MKYHRAKTGKEYMVRIENKKTIYEHREVMEKILGRKLLSTEHVDHIDGNGLNNDPNNLRIASRLENIRNQRKKSGNRSSKYKGVNFYKRYSKWQSRATVNYKAVSLGYFDTEIEAALAYDKFVKENFGEFAKTNF
jgi:hypothetical protein